MSDLLPDSATLAWWATAWLRGAVVTDQVLDHLAASGDVHSVQVLDSGVPDGPEEGTDRPLQLLVALRRAGATGLGLALPLEGDPLGLGGPAGFNDAALEAGEAVVAVGAELGAVPHRVGRGVTWTLTSARRRMLPDVGEADRALRSTVAEAARVLAALDVARWRPEVADALMDLRHLTVPEAPPGTPARCVELAARGLQATGIVDLALGDDGAAVSSGEMAARREALLPLERAGRRALVAACSPDVWPED